MSPMVGMLVVHLVLSMMGWIWDGLGLASVSLGKRSGTSWADTFKYKYAFIAINKMQTIRSYPVHIAPAVYTAHLSIGNTIYDFSQNLRLLPPLVKELFHAMWQETYPRRQTMNLKVRHIQHSAAPLELQHMLGIPFSAPLIHICSHQLDDKVINRKSIWALLLSHEYSLPQQVIHICNGIRKGSW